MTFPKHQLFQQAGMIWEIQIRTKLQDAWAEFTHEVHNKIPSEFQADYETAIAEIARRLVERVFIHPKPTTV
jgi:ppGpp synthetase/RelA/SpoT-type nucleotidyltranferase